MPVSGGSFINFPDEIGKLEFCINDNAPRIERRTIYRNCCNEHPINRLTHKIGIPMIAVSILLIPISLFITKFWMLPLSLFVIGWILQFIGHYFEGKPPEFFKDYRFLFVGLRWWIKKTLQNDEKGMR